jgi:hypothetical protein
MLGTKCISPLLRVHVQTTPTMGRTPRCNTGRARAPSGCLSGRTRPWRARRAPVRRVDVCRGACALGALVVRPCAAWTSVGAYAPLACSLCARAPRGRLSGRMRPWRGRREPVCRVDVCRGVRSLLACVAAIALAIFLAMVGNRIGADRPA